MRACGVLSISPMAADKSKWVRLLMAADILRHFVHAFRPRHELVRRRKEMRSIVLIAGRLVCRRGRASSWLGTTISNVLKSFERPRQTANCRMRRKAG